MKENTDFTELTREIRKIVLQNYQKNKKSDGSWVTDIDHALDKCIRDFLALYSDAPVFSEEVNFSELIFPCFIVDPLDGTKDFIKGNGEYSVSIAYANSHLIDDHKSFGWIYRPTTDEIFGSSLSQTRMTANNSILVSRSEYEAGLYKEIEKKCVVNVRGSICLKLGMLANNLANAVISLRPKSVWDIAAGSIMLNKIGVDFYEEGIRIDKLEHRRYGPKLIWAQKNEVKDFLNLI